MPLAVMMGMGVFSMNLMAASLSLPHDYQAGEVISADVLNENFERLRVSNTDLPLTELQTLNVSDWRCVKYMDADSYNNNIGVLNTAAYETVGPDLLLYRTLSTASVVLNVLPGVNPGTYSWTSTPVNAFTFDDNCTGSGALTGLGGDLVVSYTQCSDSAPMTTWLAVERKSPSRIKIMPSGGQPVLLCDKSNQPPIAPTSLTALASGNTASGVTVTLTWADNSTDETDFRILRKDSLTGSYVFFDSVGVDTVIYTDISNPPAGHYWYRVEALKGALISTGSNAAKITIVN